MGDIFTHLRWKKKPGYILEDIKDPGNIGKKKKIFCQKAIIWLLSKAAHSTTEIADHFEISPELVGKLLAELIANKRVVKLADSDRYQATLGG
jgi:hypothetical protein